MSAATVDILDDLIQKLDAEESEIMRELKATHEKITRDYHKEIKKYIKWKVIQKKNLADYQRRYLLQRLKEQRDKITHDIHEHMGWIRLVQRYKQEN